MIGRTISHYKILEKIGEGGMGIVYKALDTKLKRDVALKFLPRFITSDEVLKKRFIKEAVTASSFEDKNICIIHEIDETDDGQTFIVMGYYEGETLRRKLDKGSLDVSTALDIAIQTAEGLSTVHKKGIIHRDIKPANLMIVNDGTVKILDFGIAKLKDGTRLTKIGGTLGTTSYMSPEQALGKEIDHRADIWSVGIVLYEMLTGAPPFRGEYEQAVLYSILNEKPEKVSSLNPDIPAELERIVEKMTEKDRSRRYPDFKILLIDLKKSKEKLKKIVRPRPVQKQKKRTQRHIKPKKKPIIIGGIISLAILILLSVVLFKLKIAPEKSALVPNRNAVSYFGNRAGDSRLDIVVLPFVDMSPNKDQEYFCDGISDEIINALSKLKNVRVIARTSAFSFKGKNVDVREIARRLNVKTLLEGSVRKSGKQLRITAQLINASDNSHLWSETYDKKESDIFAIQEDIAKNIADKLKIQTSGSTGKALVNVGTDNLEAYHLYLKGMNLRYYSRYRIQDDIPQIIKYFKQAIELDPNYAQAYAQLATMLAEAFYEWKVVGFEALAEAKEAAVRSVQLDDTLPAAYIALGQTRAMGGKWEDSEKYYRKAIELDPSYSMGYFRYARCLMQVFRHKEAHDYFEKAFELDPLNQDLIEWVIWSRVARYDYAGAEELIKDLERIGFKADERFVYFDYSRIMLLTGRVKEAEERVKEGLLKSPRSLDVIRSNVELLSYKGNYDDALKQSILALKLYPDSYYALYQLGHSYSRLGQDEEAVKLFKKSGRKNTEMIALGKMGEKDIVRSYAAEAEKAFNIRISGKFDLNTDLPYTSPYAIALLYAALGDREKMYQWLDKAYDIRDYDLGRHITVDYRLDPYKNEPRFKALLKKMNLKP